MECINGANSKIIGLDHIVETPPRGIFSDGQTISYIQNPTDQNWYAIRATQKRAKSVYDSLMSLSDSSIEPYFPTYKKVIYSNDDFDNPTQDIVDEPVDPNLLFVRCQHQRMLYYLYDELRPRIPGFTAYYNHCITNEWGRNDLLIVPENQMRSFRLIVDSGNENILVDQSQVPSFLDGDDVVVVGGPFAGVEGKVLKFKGERRVFVQLDGLGCFGTAYVPKNWIRKVKG